MNASEAGGDLALIQTSLLSYLNANKLASKQLGLHNKSREAFIKTRSPKLAAIQRSGLTEPTTAQWSIGNCMSIKGE